MAEPLSEEELNRRFRARFEKKIEVQKNGCWHWTGTVQWTGYGQVRRFNKAYPAHIWSWIHHGKYYDSTLDLGHVCHDMDKSCEGGVTCLHRRCVNPDHLEQQTRSDNLKHNGRKARREDKFSEEHKNHELGRKGGVLYCKSCRRAKAKETGKW